MKKTFKYIFISCLLIFQLKAQLGPGYMGKRFVAGYGFYFSPTFFGSNGSEESIIGRGNSVGGDLAFNSMHEGFVEYAFKNRTSIGLSAKFYNTTFDNNKYVDVYYGNYATSSEHPSGFYQIKGMDYSLYFKFYHKRYVAPWGRYILLGPVLSRYNCSYDPTAMYVLINDYNNGGQAKFNNFGLQQQSYLRGDIRFGFGRSRIAFNRLTIDYGLNVEVIALALSFGGGVDESVADLFSEQLTNLNYIEKTSRSRVREVSRINAYLKLGFLLF